LITRLKKYKWIPWVGIGFAGLVLVILFTITARSMRKDPEDAEVSEKREDPKISKHPENTENMHVAGNLEKSDDAKNPNNDGTT